MKQKHTLYLVPNLDVEDPTVKVSKFYVMIDGEYFDSGTKEYLKSKHKNLYYFRMYPNVDFYLQEYNSKSL